MWSEAELIQIRRDLHQIPEIGLEEFATHRYLMEKIQQLQKDYMEIREWQTAILVRVKGSQPEKCIGWRTDIDGLPIKERTGLPFASHHEGRMHACGHDFHMTIALGLLAKLSATQPKNDYLFLFQPAEENEAGGQLVYESGIMDDWLPDEFYALHVNPDLPVGTIGTRMGTLFAGTCEIHAHFIGKSGHAAFPHQANDMIVAASAFVQQVQSIVSRNVNPIEGGVVTLGSFHAGSATNVIAGEAHLSGTIRTLTQTMGELIQQRVREIAKGIEQIYNCKVELQLLQKGYFPVENNPELTEKFIHFMQAQPSVNLVITEPAMTGEDFGFLLSKIPGSMFWLGVESEYGLHHEKFLPNEAAIAIAIEHVGNFLKQLDQ